MKWKLFDWFSLLFTSIFALDLAVGDDSVCFNNCNGHGHCVDYTCHCFPGFHGDDCGTTYAPNNGQDIIPILGAGHFNLTSKKALKTMLDGGKGIAAVILGFTSPDCHRCITAEYQYDTFLKDIEKSGGGIEAISASKGSGKREKTTNKVKFGRVDISASEEMKLLALELGATDIPSLVVFPTVKSASKREKRGVLYQGHQHHIDIRRFVEKLISGPMRPLTTTEEAERFLVLQGDLEEYPSSSERIALDQDRARASAVVGFFSSPTSMEEDEYEEYTEVATTLRVRDDLHFGVVKDKQVIAAFKKAKIIDRTPSLVLYTSASAYLESVRQLAPPSSAREELVARIGYKAINLDELFAEGSNRGGVQSWIVENTVPLVGKLTNSNFALYGQINKPMLMLFLDLNREKYITVDSENALVAVGGKTGGLLNQNLINEFIEVAKEHRDSFSFVYLDGTVHEDQMRNLGLYGGAARLPSLAFNTRDNLQAPFPEELALNKDTILTYCAAMLSGKLRTPKDSEEVARKALQSAIPMNRKNLAVREEVKAPAEPVKGVLEHFDDDSEGDHAIVKLSASTFEEDILQQYEEKDVLLMLHAHSGVCEQCGHFAVYFKKMAERFADLHLSSLVIARLDVSSETPPAWMKLLGEATLPVMVLLPAGAKYPPWQFYSGVGKVGPMMKWVHKQVAVPFQLPNLPHLTPDQKELYKTQVREREQVLAEKRTREAADMAAMDELREEVRVRNEERERERLDELSQSIEELSEGEDDEVEEEEEDGPMVSSSGKEEYKKDPELEAQLAKYGEVLAEREREREVEVELDMDTEGKGRLLGRKDVALEEKEFERKLQEMRKKRIAQVSADVSTDASNGPSVNGGEEDEDEHEDEVVQSYQF